MLIARCVLFVQCNIIYAYYLYDNCIHLLYDNCTHFLYNSCTYSLYDNCVAYINVFIKTFSLINIDC